MAKKIANPFEGFDPNKADQLLNLAEKICDDEPQAAMHLAACLMGLVPDLEYAHVLCECVDIQGGRLPSKRKDIKNSLSNLYGGKW